MGIASEMMNVLIENAKEIGYEQMELQVVATNKPAIHLYSKFGFYETGYINNGMMSMPAMAMILCGIVIWVHRAYFYKD